MSEDTRSEVRLGFVAGVYGVRGWVKIHSFTDPRENIVEYGRWTLKQNSAARVVEVLDGRIQGKTVVARIGGVNDRDGAAALVGAEIFVPRVSLPECGPGEYYWADLEGLTVLDRDGNALGRIHHLIDTGAHDVLVLDGSPERLIPFVMDEVVAAVDLQKGTLTVTWDAGYWDE